MRGDVGHQREDHVGDPVSPEREEGKEQRDAEAVAPRDRSPFEKERVAGEDEKPRPRSERGAGPDDRDRRKRDAKLDGLQRRRRIPERRERAQQQIPERRMPLVVEVGKERAERGRMHGEHQRLQLVAPGDVIEDQRDLQRDERGKCEPRDDAGGFV